MDYSDIAKYSMYVICINCIKGNLGHIKATIEGYLQVYAYYVPENIRIFHKGIILQARIAENPKLALAPVSVVLTLRTNSNQQNNGGVLGERRGSNQYQSKMDQENFPEAQGKRRKAGKFSQEYEDKRNRDIEDGQLQENFSRS